MSLNVFDLFDHHRRNVYITILFSNELQRGSGLPLRYLGDALYISTTKKYNRSPA